ncbi:MAG: hypothetical protein KDC87_20910, partial [Planctomycetes bacterium]|nr:hypothetical protein [Planctomycetota bacterium]
MEAQGRADPEGPLLALRGHAQAQVAAAAVGLQAVAGRAILGGRPGVDGVAGQVVGGVQTHGPDRSGVAVDAELVVVA